jgi:hypothetical protein
MKPVTAFGMAVVLSSMLAAPGFAMVSSEQAREANARNAAPTATAPGAPNSPGQSGSYVTVGPGSANHEANRPLGYGKGAAENSAVGKDSHDSNSQLGANQSGNNNQLGQRDSTNPAATDPGCGGYAC